MLNPRAKFVVSGTVWGVDVEVDIKVGPASDTDPHALPALTQDGSLSVTDIQNVSTMFVTGVSKVLAQLEALEQANVNPFRQAPEEQAPGKVPADVVKMSDYLKGKES